MILRDATGSAVGHTEVFTPETPTITLPTPAAFLPAYGESDAHNFIANLWASAEKF